MLNSTAARRIRLPNDTPAGFHPRTRRERLLRTRYRRHGRHGRDTGRRRSTRLESNPTRARAPGRAGRHVLMALGASIIGLALLKIILAFDVLVLPMIAIVGLLLSALVILDAHLYPDRQDPRKRANPGPSRR